MNKKNTFIVETQLFVKTDMPRVLSYTNAMFVENSFWEDLKNRLLEIWNSCLEKWKSFLNKMTVNPRTKKSFYMHKMLRRTLKISVFTLCRRTFYYFFYESIPASAVIAFSKPSRRLCSAILTIICGFLFWHLNFF